MLTLYRPSLARTFGGFVPSRRFFGRDLFQPLSAGEEWFPRVELTQENGQYVLQAEVPGMEKEDVHVDVQNGVLTLRGERRDEREEEYGGCRCSERYYGSFERSFDLPPDARVDEIKAHLDKGVLTVTVPSPGDETSGRKVEVTVN